MPPEEPEKELTFHDITNSAEFQPGFEIPWTLLITIATVLMVLVLISLIVISYLVKNKKEPAPILGTPVKDALAKLQSLHPSLDSKNVQQAATDLSVIVREALTYVTKAPALFQSQEEFHRGDFQLEDTALRQGFQDHLNTLWELEYSAPQTNPQLVQEQFSTTENLLKKLSQYHQ